MSMPMPDVTGQNSGAAKLIMSDALAYSIDDVCKMTATGRTAIFEAIRNGALRARKNGRRTLILAADLRAWLEGLPLVSKRTSAT